MERYDTRERGHHRGKKRGPLGVRRPDSKRSEDPVIQLIERFPLPRQPLGGKKFD